MRHLFVLLLTSQLARKSMQLVYFSTWNTASGRRVCNIDIALQARGCWKWQGSILYPSSKTMDRLSGKWEEDSTNCWTRMEENGTISASGKVACTRHNPTPTPCYLLYTGEILLSDIAPRNSALICKQIFCPSGSCMPY